jgi:hypothetical protein
MSSVFTPRHPAVRLVFSGVKVTRGMNIQMQSSLKTLVDA